MKHRVYQIWDVIFYKLNWCFVNYDDNNQLVVCHYSNCTPNFDVILLLSLIATL